MAVKDIKKILENALINDSEMQHGLYEYELEELLDYLKSSLIKDRDDFIFAVTVNKNDVAMVLIEKSKKKVYVNELARNKLKELWSNAYFYNINKLIPVFAKQLNKNEIPINGVKTMLPC